ncbi:YwaF family protein [Sutcliffiella halmapala]|uniref:YwaF family protein n=1 Tax=Sutcliffiella halmapala TaxID=79882 RepID=UPI000994E7C9|nr:TIGR02206 family membrane protein [Sutcliffiella halmapala]
MFESYTDPNAFMEGTILLSPAHIASLIVTMVLIIFLYIFREQFIIKRYGRWLIFLSLLGSEVWLNYWYLATEMWDISYTLPFQLCSISLYLCMWMLLTKQNWSFEVAYFLGIGGALQAILTPELFYDFPHFRFIHFFIAHIAIILAVLYMIWVERRVIRIQSLWKAFGLLQIIALFVFFMNRLTGGNYMFLAKKPSSASLIDFLGPYPWYILSLEIVVLSLFFILYAPFLLLHRKKTTQKASQH